MEKDSQTTEVAATPRCKHCSSEQSLVAQSSQTNHYLCLGCGRFSRVQRPASDIVDPPRPAKIVREKGTAIKDGAIFEYPALGLECTNCGAIKRGDMFFFLSRAVCGDCRYRLKHGHWPHRTSGAGNPNADVYEADPRYHGGYGSETLHRQIELDAVTEQHAHFLNGWLDESKLSLD